MRTEGQIARRFRDIEPVYGLEPLPFLVHQTHDRDGRVTDLRGEVGDIVVGSLGERVENVVCPEPCEACGFVFGKGRRFHCDKLTEPASFGEAVTRSVYFNFGLARG